MAPDPTPKIDVKRLVSLSARVGETKSWLVVGTARNVDVVQVQFVEPWLIDPVIAYCRSQHDALPAEWQPIDVAADEKVWVARFDIELFGRYALLAHLLTHLEASRDAEAVIQVTSVGTDQPVQAPSRPFTRNDVGWDPYEFDVGVLLVHGIGPHVRGQTLVNFSDPLIKFIHGWFRGFNDWSASNYAGESGKLREAVETGPLANDPGHWGLREELERFTSRVRTDGKAGEATATGAPLFGSAQVSKVVLAQSPNEPDTPANAVIRLAVIDDAAAPREASVLLSEAWWAPATVPPTRQQLLDWVFRVLPLMVSSHITLPLRRAQRHRAAARSSLSQFIAACEEWLARIWVLFVFGPLSLLLCLAMQVLLSVLGAIAALPIPRLKAWLTPVLEWLMGAPGQSYVIVHSPVRRGSILSDVDRNLDWICSRCRKVIILAHSQGATAAHVVLTNKGAQQFPREEAIRQLITVGSGIRKLKMLEAEGSTGFPSFCVNAIFVLFAVLGLLRWQQENWVWLLDLLHPQHSWLAQALDPSNDIRIVVGALLLASIAFILYGEAAGNPSRWQLKALPKIPWTDYYASHDPVPSGPLDIEHGPEKFEVNNCASILSDHNTYWDNTEEVVAPIAMSIMRETGLPFENLMTGDDTCLVEARQRRAHRVRNLARIKVATAITVATFLSLLLLVNWERWGDALLALPTERTVWGTVSLYGPMLPDAIWEVMPIVIVLAWSWGESWLLWGRMAREAAALSKRRGAGLGIRTIIARLVLRLSAVGLLVLWWRSGDRGTALLAQWDDSISRISAYLASFRSLPTAQFETSLRFDPTSVDSYAKLVELWGRAIKSPEQLLATPFTPTWQQLTDAFEFYVLMLVLSALMYGFIVLFLVRGGLLPYLNSSARGVLSLVTAAAVAMALHLAFVWLGGRASFYGTAAAYIYGIAPYLPLASMTAIIMVWAMPASRRLDAMNSRTTSVARQKAMQEAMQNPETSKGLFLVGSLLFVALWALNLFAIFRALSYAHGLGGMALAGAVLLSLPMTALAGLLVQLAANGLGRILLMNAPSSMARQEAAAQ